jgi:hypothetical protein
MPDRLKRPRDPAQLAKLMIDIASSEVEDRERVDERARGRPGGPVEGHDGRRAAGYPPIAMTFS